MKIDTYNQNGEKIGQTMLPKEIFELSFNRDLVHQVVVAQSANRRQVLANTKGRGEVSGGGRKPWRQKGTGRARHGSSRSPIWRHGGITFGPKAETIFKKGIPNRMKRQALFMALSDKAKNNLLIVLEDLKLEKAKTKLMAEVLGKLPLKGKRTLIALASMDKNLIQASRNIPRAAVVQARDLNCLDILTSKYLIMPKKSIKVIQDTFLNNK
ncbi:MAG: 50S ribosomal protein L4 [Patescibacteria group bacterium]